MSESLKTGLLIFIAALLAVNTYLLVSKDNVAYKDPAQAKANFERTAHVDASPAAAKKVALDQANAAKPLADQLNKKPSAPVTSLKFDKTSYDFGNITQDSENKTVFSFTNTGSEPLIIENAKGSCGCTVPEYPKEPVAPGETADIKVVYKPGKQKNAQTKTVTITANTVPSNTVLTIKANVAEV